MLSLPSPNRPPLLDNHCRQGNLELYSTANVAKRQALKHSRNMIASIKQHWDLLAAKKGNGAWVRELSQAAHQKLLVHFKRVPTALHAPTTPR